MGIREATQIHRGSGAFPETGETVCLPLEPLSCDWHQLGSFRLSQEQKDAYGIN